MIQKFFPSSLYNFLRFTNSVQLEKIVLDCGAGGSDPKLAFFHENGFKTYGIDISEESIEGSNKFCEKYGIRLNIIKGDMRNIPFDPDFFSFIFSYNSIFHLSKGDCITAINEMYRVLKKGGLCYINFLSKDDYHYDDEDDFHSYYDDDEPDKYFNHFIIIYKEKRQILKGNYFNTGRTCILDYIVKKP